MQSTAIVHPPILIQSPFNVEHMLSELALIRESVEQKKIGEEEAGAAALANFLAIVNMEVIHSDLIAAEFVMAIFIRKIFKKVDWIEDPKWIQCIDRLCAYPTVIERLKTPYFSLSYLFNLLDKIYITLNHSWREDGSYCFPSGLSFFFPTFGNNIEELRESILLHYAASENPEVPLQLAINMFKEYKQNPKSQNFSAIVALLQRAEKAGIPMARFMISVIGLTTPSMMPGSGEAFITSEEKRENNTPMPGGDIFICHMVSEGHILYPLKCQLYSPQSYGKPLDSLNSAIGFLIDPRTKPAIMHEHMEKMLVHLVHVKEPLALLIHAIKHCTDDPLTAFRHIEQAAWLGLDYALLLMIELINHINEGLLKIKEYSAAGSAYLQGLLLTLLGSATVRESVKENYQNRLTQQLMVQIDEQNRIKNAIDMAALLKLHGAQLKACRSGATAKDLEELDAVLRVTHGKLKRSQLVIARLAPLTPTPSPVSSALTTTTATVINRLSSTPTAITTTTASMSESSASTSAVIPVIHTKADTSTITTTGEVLPRPSR